MVKWEKIPDIEKPWLKYWPKETPRNLDYELIRLDEVLERNAKKFPQSNAIYFMGYRLTYEELNDLVDRFATSLSKMGVKQRDVVLIDLPNLPQFVIAFFAILRIGAIANPIIPLNKYAEIVHQANDSNAKMLIILDTLYEEHLYEKDLSKMPTLKMIIMTEIAEYLSPIKKIVGKLFSKVPYMKNWPKNVGGINFIPFQDLLHQKTKKELPQININPEKDVAVLIYTGGTTGAPKGVQITHFNLIANCTQGFKFVTTQLPKTLETVGYGGIITVLPLAHSFAMTMAMSLGLFCAYQLILFPRPPEPLSDILKVIIKENATFAPGVPTLWNKINLEPNSAKYKQKLNKTDFVACMSAAAPLPLEVKLKFEEITGATLIEGYGMSEASPMLTGNPFKRSRENTVGLPVSDTYLKIVDAEKGNKILGNCPHLGEYCVKNCGNDGEQKYIGEICGSGPQIMQGYLNRPDATAYALRKDQSGIIWYFTADIGCIDGEGYLHIKDRKRDMIKYKGHSVFPREVEDLMYQHEAIKEVGVYGLRDLDPEIGESINAVVSIKDDYIGKITEDDLLEWVKSNISSYKYPRKIKIVHELPKSIIGKVLRRVLREDENLNSENID